MPSSTLPTAVRERVSRRDRERCRCCGTSSSLHIHHINYRSQGGPDEDWNLIVLCHGCHALVHSNKGRWQPLLRAYIWILYVDRRPLSIPQIERRLLRQLERAS